VTFDALDRFAIEDAMFRMIEMGPRHPAVRYPGRDDSRGFKGFRGHFVTCSAAVVLRALAWSHAMLSKKCGPRRIVLHREQDQILKQRSFGEFILQAFHFVGHELPNGWLFLDSLAPCDVSKFEWQAA